MKARTVTRVYGEDEEGAWWVWRGHPEDILGRGREPMLGRAEDILRLRSGFALRVDDLWRAAVQRDLSECHQCDVASLPRNPIAEFLNDISPAHS